MSLELTFEVKQGGNRQISVRIHPPYQSSPDAKWPWSIDVEVEGRTYELYGMNPLDAVENAAFHAAGLLNGQYGEAITPAVAERSTRT